MSYVVLFMCICVCLFLVRLGPDSLVRLCFFCCVYLFFFFHDLALSRSFIFSLAFSVVSFFSSSLMSPLISSPVGSLCLVHFHLFHFFLFFFFFIDPPPTGIYSISLHSSFLILPPRINVYPGISYSVLCFPPPVLVPP